MLGFSFTKAELEQNNALKVMRDVLHPLDIRLTQDSNLTDVTHVFSKKRQNPRVLLALIQGKYVVNQGFLDAVATAAAQVVDENGNEASSLETDFEGNWPDATKYLPPAADGPGNEQPNGSFSPDPRRRTIFDGYTFIFYHRKRFDDLLHVITSAKGKALLREVEPARTEIDDFIRYVKTVAGEKGLGEFEDGSEGRGVVVVRHTPQGEEHSEWYLNFYNQVALRLDHRPIEPRDLLPAILDVEPEQLRRPLEVEPTPHDSGEWPRSFRLCPAHVADKEIAIQDPIPSRGEADHGAAMDIDMVPDSPVIEDSPPPPYRPRGRGTQRRAFKSTFKGFDVASDDDDDEPEVQAHSQPPLSAPADESQGMFMTQPDEMPGLAQNPETHAPGASRSQRKRPAPFPERDIMEELAPTAARIKRMRLEGRDDALPTTVPPTAAISEPEPEPVPSKPKGKSAAKTAKGRGRGKKKTSEDSDDELLDQFITAAQQEEAERQRESDLIRRQLLEGEIDLGEIRKATVTQTIHVRRRDVQPEPSDEPQRWNPRWNGLRNFKKFRKQTDEGAGGGRAQPRKIVSLQPVKAKEYGMNDEYWLERSSVRAQSRGPRTHPSQSQAATQRSSEPRPSSRGAAAEPIVLGDDSDSEGNASANDNTSLPDVVDMSAAAEPSRSRKGKASAKALRQGAKGQIASQAAVSSTQGKRTASGPPTAAAEKPAKRRATRATRRAAHESDDDSEDGGLTFRFGARK